MNLDVRESVQTLLLTILFWTFCGSLSAGEKIKINVRQSDAAIRERLLSVTPTGTGIKEVYQLLQYRFQRDGRVVGGPEEPRPFKGALSIHLGHYFEPRNLYLFPTVVQVFWYFDEHDRLRDIQVRRVVSGM
jgi:hypothetical protein